MPARHPLSRLARVVVGMVLGGVAFSLVVRAHLGLGPWHVLAAGIANRSTLSLGLAAIALNGVLFVASVLLRERPGLGTLGAVTLGGVAIDASLPLLPTPDAALVRLAFLLVGLVVMSFGGALYMSARVGTSPLDAVMTGLYRRARLPIAAVRLGLEVLGFALGWWAGGEVGLGCVVIGLGIGPLMQFWLSVLGAMPERADDPPGASYVPTGPGVDDVPTEPGVHVAPVAASTAGGRWRR